MSTGKFTSSSREINSDQPYLASQTRKVIQYLVDIVECLNCPVDDLIHKCHMFKNAEEVANFVDKGYNFSILTNKDDLIKSLFFLPVIFVPLALNSCLHVQIIKSVFNELPNKYFYPLNFNCIKLKNS